ncbi:glycosyltransferase family 9 protein [Thermodesulfatator atlanticus]|uniref:glycosyltransferase family 9 protein n=1 Tax=Thermodesulfatator atlanticus TaxID=501497 RepID=UPI0003B3D2F1|nr:glycosyltransferase family 9 protein [Thermodesulfatator atlanticus]
MKKVLFIQARDYGDAVISTKLINTLGKNLPDLKLDVFTKPIFVSIYKNNPYINKIYCSNFPIGKSKRLDVISNINLIKTILRLRKNKYKYVLNIVGDIRENFIGKLINPKKNIGILWHNDHLYARFIRNGNGKFLDEKIKVPRDVINIYDILDFIATYFGCKKIEPPKIFLDQEKLLKIKFSIQQKIIAIHPFTKKKHNFWSFDKWIKLINILKKDHILWIFCAPDERKVAEHIFKDLINNEKVSIQTGNLEDFFIKLSLSKLLIGLDSFAVHVAYALNVPNIMLNGPNNYKIWQPKNTKVVCKTNVCKYYPCYNKPLCVGRNFEYICMKAIEVEDVLMTVKEVIK